MINIVEFLAKKHLSLSNIDFVDLGMPSGTEWAKCNLGANKPEEFGLYYQWGSLEGHEAKTFDFNEYDYYEKYDEIYHGLSLREKDDVAYVESKELARIPNDELIQELIDNCEYEWTKLNGIIGAKFTGPNGNFIFIPAAGCCSGSSVRKDGSYVYIWSLSLTSANPQISYGMYCDSSRTYISNYRRYYGFSVRPVLSKK